MTIALPTDTVTKPRVTSIRIDADRAMYFCEEMSFDEEDRDLAYIDHIMGIWQAWRDYVEKNGERSG
jgi:hypothetical protein